jgi:YD repeat-containing protein
VTTFDTLGRVVRVVTAAAHDVNGVTTFVYDGAGDPGEIGRLTSTASPDGVVTAYQYDAMGRNVQTTWQVGQDVYDVWRTYDSLGRLDTIEYPHVPGRAPFVVRQQYNSRGYAASRRGAASTSPPSSEPPRRALVTTRRAHLTAGQGPQ